MLWLYLVRNRKVWYVIRLKIFFSQNVGRVGHDFVNQPIGQRFRILENIDMAKNAWWLTKCTFVKIPSLTTAQPT